MKKILNQYLSASFIFPFFLSTLFLISFLLIFEMLKITKLIVNKGIPLLTIFKLLIYVGASFIPMAVPLSILFATVYVVGRLSGDSEFIAMRTIGLSKEKIFLPFLWPALLIGLTTFMLAQTLIPEATKKVKFSVTQLTSKGLLADIKKGRFFTEVPGVLIFANDVKQQGKELEDIFIQIKKDTSQQIIFAKKGEMEKSSAENLESTNLGLVLFDGSIIKTFDDNNNVEKILFERYRFPVVQGNLPSTVLKKESMLNGRDLLAMIKKGAPSDDKEGKETYVRWLLEFFGRFNIPLLCVLFSMFGMTFGVQRTRGEGPGSVVMCLAVLIIYNALFFALVGLAKSGKVHASIAIFLPTILGTMLALRLFKRLEWIS